MQILKCSGVGTAGFTILFDMSRIAIGVEQKRFEKVMCVEVMKAMERISEISEVDDKLMRRCSIYTSSIDKLINLLYILSFDVEVSIIHVHYFSLEAYRLVCKRKIYITFCFAKEAKVVY